MQNVVLVTHEPGTLQGPQTVCLLIMPCPHTVTVVVGGDCPFHPVEIATDCDTEKGGVQRRKSGQLAETVPNRPLQIL